MVTQESLILEVSDVYFLSVSRSSSVLARCLGDDFVAMGDG